MGILDELDLKDVQDVSEKSVSNNGLYSRKLQLYKRHLDMIGAKEGETVEVITTDNEIIIHPKS